MSLTSTENAVTVNFESAHNTIEEVWPGKDVPSVGDTGRWTAAGQHLDLQQKGGEDQLILREKKHSLKSPQILY